MAVVLKSELTRAFLYKGEFKTHFELKFYQTLLELKLSTQQLNQILVLLEIEVEEKVKIESNFCNFLFLKIIRYIFYSTEFHLLEGLLGLKVTIRKFEFDTFFKAFSKNLKSSSSSKSKVLHLHQFAYFCIVR